MQEIDRYAMDNVNKLLVGNKCDMTSKKVVTFDEGKELADSHGIKFIETSAKSSHNVEEAFHIMASEIKAKVQVGAAQPRPQQQTTRLGPAQPVNQSGCCGFL